jgi:MerR family transcriptional regulator, thiopeptide resistance regulator
MKPPPWKIGELAAGTGLSIRALHHYDQIGLLVPSQRTPSGHRLYDQADIARLQQIQSLRLMGLSLHEVRRLLSDEAMSPRHLIDLHLARLHDVITLQRRLVRHLRALATHIDANEVASVGDLCCIIQEMTVMEQYFTRDQLALLDQRRAQVGEERLHEIRDAWAEIIPAVQTAMNAGVDPTSPEILAIARRWKALEDEMTGGDPAISSAIRIMYERMPVPGRHGPAPTGDMYRYMDQAFAILLA